MEWVLIVALGGLAWLQSQRIDALTKRLADLEEFLGLSEPAPVAPPAPVPTPFMPQDEAPAPAPAPEPLLLDTPLPEPSNDREDESELLLEFPVREAHRSNETAPPEPIAAAPAIATTSLAQRAVNAARLIPRGPALEKWLAENGFAWIGGGALALGAVFLVGFAAQSGFFTPPLRLGAAVVLGLVLIGLGEFLRQQAERGGFGHPLAAALLAGAGVAAFYAAAWAAHALYGYIDWRLAACALVACAVVLFVLSHWHGEPLAVLAAGATLLAPALASVAVWPSLALTLFVCAVGASALALAAYKRWPWAAAATLLGLYFWFASAIVEDAVWRSLALLSVATIGGVAMHLRAPKPEETEAPFTWSRANALAPTVVICVSSVFMLWTWLSVAPVVGASPAGPALVAMLHVALAALAVRRGAAQAPAFAVSVGGLVIGLVLYMRARAYFEPGAPDLYVWPLAAAAMVALAAFGARAHAGQRALTHAAGAAGAALLIILAVFSRPIFAAPAVWAVLLLSAALAFGAAWFAARDAADESNDWPVDVWVYAGAVLALIGMESLAPASARPAAHAALGFAAGLLVMQRGWRGAGWAALAAATLSIAHALSPDFSGDVIAGDTPLWSALLILAATAIFLYGASQISARREPNGVASEGLHTAALIVAIIAFFLALRWFAAGGAGATLNGFTENALRALTLMAAGFILTPRPGAPYGRIASFRGHALFALGALLALLSSCLSFNPWWGAERVAPWGVPFINANAIAFAAPAMLCALAARRIYDERLRLARLYAGGALLFALLWAVLEVRFAFQGASIATAPIGLLEGGLYGLIALCAALALTLAARVRAGANPDRPFTRDLVRVADIAAYAGIAVGVFILLIFRHPWWGAHSAGFTDAVEIAFAVLAQAVAVGLCLLLGRVLSRDRPVDFTRFAAASAAVLFALSFGHALIRYLHHFGEADNGAPLAGVEGFAHALWPLALVIGGSWATLHAPGRETIRQYLYDLEAIWSTAIWPALAFGALGIIFIYNPWWGLYLSRLETPWHAVAGLALIVTAAWLSWRAQAVPHVRFQPALANTAIVLCVAYGFVALSLIVRYLFHGAAMRASAEGSGLETWTYSALWAAFGAGVLALGAMRQHRVLRWCGMALLMMVTAKVFLFDMQALNGVVRAASFIGLGAVLVLVTWLARRFNARALAPRGDLFQPH